MIAEENITGILDSGKDGMIPSIDSSWALYYDVKISQSVL
jgi:hypothetical protein